ncbi:SMP-30/gluconolactonase/LRE family protein [Polyangium mundeleinium]|uniref:SMP-30/Gluconolactonase/LRE-like region domain-containing protein n=1 Tax=Polyangium mundeleinium TaxID=2995306 RepID=A0ABT5ERY4_9BACT|nr:hypothetical protein [Polyangium mundeleinium]MDC0743973.1 hypothetical protein [Polyangium mundeleinium]
MTRSRVRLGGNRIGSFLGAAVAVALVLQTQSPSAAPKHCGDFLARVAELPGYPDGIVLQKNRVYVAGPALGVDAGGVPSEIAVFHGKTGAHLETIPIQGEDLAAPHALTGLSVDADGRLYAVSSQLGVLRLSEKKHGKWKQSVYAGPFPDIPSCTPGDSNDLCAHNVYEMPPMPSDIAFAKDGHAYVTDAAQAMIYRIPPGGGAPEIWLRSAKLAGYYDLQGARGILVSADGKSLYVTVGFSADAPWEGRIYKIRRVPAPNENDVTLVHVFPNFEAPSGLGLGEDGELFVALSITSQIAVVKPAGGELGRFSSATNDEVPLDGPAHMAFDGKGGLFVTNQAVPSGLLDRFAVVEVDVKDQGHKNHPPKPNLP